MFAEEYVLIRSGIYQENKDNQSYARASLINKSEKALDNFVCHDLGHLTASQRLFASMQEYGSDSFIGCVHKLSNTNDLSKQLCYIKQALRSLEEVPQKYININDYEDLTFVMLDLQTLVRQSRIFVNLFINELNKIISDETIAKVDNLTKEHLKDKIFGDIEISNLDSRNILSRSKFFKHISSKKTMRLADLERKVTIQTKYQTNETLGEFYTICDKLNTRESDDLIDKIISHKNEYIRKSEGRYKELVKSLVEYVKSRNTLERFKMKFFDFLNIFIDQNEIKEIENRAIYRMNLEL